MDCTCTSPPAEHPKDATCGRCPCGRPTGRHPFHVVGLCDVCCVFYMAGRPFGYELAASVKAREAAA